jgi:CPA1 family monovalent cation:H+ antiporter
MDLLVPLLLGVLAIAASTALGGRLGVASPLLLLAVGIAVGYLPFVHMPEINPEWILIGVLPPLLYSAAVNLPAIEFRRDLRPIAGLSVVLVVVSSLLLGLFFWAVVPGLGLALGIALGAILSPTDAVATTIAKRLGIAPRVVTLLEGESLLNDATALVLLRTMVAAAALGVAGSSSGAAQTSFVPAFLWGVVVAVVVGAIVGFLNLRLRSLLSNSAANTAVGFVVPFVAYLPTERLGGSGLVAAVVAGIVTGQGAAHWFTPEQRLSDTLNWRTVELVLEGAVFLLMGLELKQIVSEIDQQGALGTGVLIAVLALLIILAVRAGYVSLLVWLQSRRARTSQRRRLESLSDRLDEIAAGGGGLPSTRKGRGGRKADANADGARAERRLENMRTRITRALSDVDYYQASPLGWKHGVVIVWAGMRGVVTLAAAQTLPRDTGDRPLLVFIAFVVAGGSLMLQGFTLPWVVRMLRLESSAADQLDRAEQSSLDDELRAAAVEALADSGLTRRDGTPFPEELVAMVGARYSEPPDEDRTIAFRDGLELRYALIGAMRTRLTALSSGGAYSTEALRHALAGLDADQLSLQLRLDDES